jgi:hypothetical protein
VLDGDVAQALVVIGGHGLELGDVEAGRGALNAKTCMRG